MAGRLVNAAGAGFIAAAVSGALWVGTPTAAASPDASPPGDTGTSQTAATTGHPAKSGNRPNRKAARSDGSARSTPRQRDEVPARADRPPTADRVTADVAPKRAGRAAHTVPVAPEPVAGTQSRPSHRAKIATRVPDTLVHDRVVAPREAAPTATAAPATTETVDTAVAAPAAATVTQTITRAPTLLNIVGSAVVNLLMGLIHLFDGPPILPPGSTVTVGSSSLVLPIGAGKSVEANWYFPENSDASTRLIYLQHGFLASAPMYSYTAARLAERTNAIVVAPSMSSNFFDPGAVWLGGSTLQRAVADLFAGDRQALTESAGAAAGHAVTLPERVVLVGHSAGGTLVTAAAGYLVDNHTIDDLAGVVLLDGVEVAGSRAVSDALAKLRGVNDRPIYLMSSQRYFWNRDGDLADKLGLARPDHFNGVGLTGGLHIDYLQGGNPLIQFAEYLVAGFSTQPNIDAAGLISAGWINDLFAGTAAGVYGPAGQSIPIATPAGPATAVVLPLGQPPSNLLWALFNGFVNGMLNLVGVFAVFDPLTPAPVTAALT